MSRLMWVRYVGGPWDGCTYATWDDQVPNVVATGKWEHYRISEKVYDDGLLVDVTYRRAPEMD